MADRRPIVSFPTDAVPAAQERAWGPPSPPHAPAPSPQALAEARAHELVTSALYGAVAAPRPPTIGGAPTVPPRNQALWGKTVTVADGGSVVTALMSPPSEEPRPYTLFVQPKGLPTGSARIQVLIRYGIGAATFTKSLQLSALATRAIPLLASFVQVELWWSQGAGLGLTLDVNVGLAAGDLGNPAAAAAPYWFSPDVAFAPQQLLVAKSTPPLWLPDAGSLVLAVDASIVALPGAGAGPWYLCGYDMPTAAVTVDAYPVPGLVSPAFSAVPTFLAFDDSLAPSIGVATGLVFALSTTPGGYVAAAAGYAFRVAIKVGS